jgi:hypothetical protein
MPFFLSLLPFQLPKTIRPLLGSSKGTSQIYNIHSKKHKKPRRATIYVCCHILNKKWCRKRNKNKTWKKHKRGSQNKKQKKSKRLTWVSPEQQNPRDTQYFK